METWTLPIQIEPNSTSKNTFQAPVTDILDSREPQSLQAKSAITVSFHPWQLNLFQPFC